ncbi:Thioredoxin domain-containing protein 17 [Cricetulus griseus]|uniref:Thioredoxin domain-containing protein 17 n=1 Tax=Cricetulus griseus TaxID=10029 RepID=G3HDR0_CRIGR|nr:Thioredoxin domain-containing protein 17 [Cricetulus griseus]
MTTFKEVNVFGFLELDQAVKEQKGKTISTYFRGSKDVEEKGLDCVEAESVVGEGLKHVTEDCSFTTK